MFPQILESWLDSNSPEIMLWRPKCSGLSPHWTATVLRLCSGVPNLLSWAPIFLNQFQCTRSCNFGTQVIQVGTQTIQVGTQTIQVGTQKKISCLSCFQIIVGVGDCTMFLHKNWNVKKCNYSCLNFWKSTPKNQHFFRDSPAYKKLPKGACLGPKKAIKKWDPSWGPQRGSSQLQAN